MIHVHTANLNCNFRYDYLRIYDGSSNQSPMLGRYCGSSIPPSLISSSNEMFIHFKSDGSVNDKGFRIEYSPSSRFTLIIFAFFLKKRHIIPYPRHYWPLTNIARSCL